MEPLIYRLLGIIGLQSGLILVLGIIIWRKNKYIETNIFRGKDN